MTILTTEANDQMEPIHDRMPVILEPGEEETWIATDDEAELELLCNPYQDEDLQTYLISRAVNSPENDSEEILEPVEVGEEAGLDDF